MTEAGTIHARYAGHVGSFAIDAAFEAPMRGVTALFGPSGCGKTTILRCMAGLTRLPGRLVVGGEVWQDDAGGMFREPYERPIGYVFQEASLFAHLSVRRNLMYGYERALKAGAKEEIRFDSVVDLLGIGPLLDRATGALSGGERQRVALGRALLAQPRVLLMDEPLSALDRMTKEEILPHFETLHGALSIPVFYVTHDISEIERLADHMVLLEAGRVIANGPLADVLSDSRLPIARSPQASSVIEARFRSFDATHSLTSFDVSGETLLVSGHVRDTAHAHRVRIAASDVSLAVERPSLTTIMNVLPAIIADIQPVGEAQANVVVTIGHREGGARVLARVTRRSANLLGFTVGQPIFAQIKAVSLVAASQGRSTP